MAADLTTYDKILKEVYAPAIVEQLNNKTILLKRIQKGGEEDYNGREFVIPTHGRRNEAIGARGATSSTVPTPGNEGYDNALLKPAYNWGTIQVSEVVIDTTSSDKGAFRRAVKSETTGMTTNMAVDINRQFFGDGTGLIVATPVGGPSATVLVTSTKNLRAGMVIDVLTRSTGAVISAARTILSVVKDTSILLDASVTTGATDGLYRQGNKVLTVNNETAGIQQIVSSTGAFEGLDPSVAGQDYWQSFVSANGGTNRPITEILMQTAFDGAAEQANGEPSLMISSFGGRRSYQNLLVSLKRFQNWSTLEGGFKVLDYNGLPFAVDRDAPGPASVSPKARIWFVDETHLKMYQLSAPSWMDGDGSILKYDQGTGYKALYHWFMNLGTDARNCHALLDDITPS
jgi:hypothetical protein